MTDKIVPQNYPCLCRVCFLEDGRTDLDRRQVREELIKFAAGRKSEIKKEDVEKYSMVWNEKLTLYECTKKHKSLNGKTAISAPDIPVKLFWSDCSKCLNTQLGLESQEAILQTVNYDRILVETPVRELKKIAKVSLVKNEKQEETVCQACGHKGLKQDNGKWF